MIKERFKKIIIPVLGTSLVLSSLVATNYSIARASSGTSVHEHKTEQQSQKIVIDLKQNKAVKQIDSYLKKEKFNGTVLIAKNGKIVLTKGYGQSNFQTKSLNNIETIFRVGSVTKTFTATAILQLVDQGKVKLDDPLIKFIPDFPSGDKITIHQLLSHTSGIPEIVTEAIWNDPVKRNQYVSQEEMVDQIKNLKLVSEPGTKYMYSNSNYALLSYIIEKASHTTWENYVNEYFFKPLKMHRSGVDINQPIIPNHAVGTGILVDKNHDMSYAVGAGSIYSTVGDLFKFDQALLSGKLISKQSLAKMFKPVLDGYSYAWFSGKDLKLSSDWKYHDGHIPGFISFNAVNKKQNMEVIMLTNKGPKTIDDFNKLNTFKSELTKLAEKLSH